MTSSKSSLLAAAILGFCSSFIFALLYTHFLQPHYSVTTAKATASQVIPTLQPTVTSSPTPTVTPTGPKTYKDFDYNFKVSFPSSWRGVLNQKTNLGLETYTIYSPDKSESLEILVSNGIWVDVKLEIGSGSQKTTFLGRPCLIRHSGDTTIYVFPSSSGNLIFRLSLAGNSSSITKIFNSFKLI